MPSFLKSLFLSAILVILGSGLSFAQSTDDCDGTEPLILDPRPSETEPTLGDIIFIDITFSPLDDVEFIQLPVTFDPLILRYIPDMCSPSSVLEGFDCDENVVLSAPGQIRIFWFHPSSQSSDVFSGDAIVSLAFEIIGVASSQSVAIAETIDGFDFEIGTTDPSNPVIPLMVSDFCQVETILNVVCTDVTPFISPCGGNDPGSASLQVQICGGVAPYTYLLQDNNGQIIENSSISSGTEEVTIENLDPGITYQLIITDDTSIEVFNEMIPILMEDAMQATIDLALANLAPIGELICAEGPQSTTPLLATVSPPSTDYIYEWRNADGDVVGSEEQANQLPVGMYFLTVTNAVTGCSTTADFDLRGPEPVRFEIDNLVGPACDDPDALGSVALTITGGRPEFGGNLGVYEVILEMSDGTGPSQRGSTNANGEITYSLQNNNSSGLLAGSEWTVMVDDNALGFRRTCPSNETTFIVPPASMDGFTFDIRNTTAACDGFADVQLFVSPAPPNPPVDRFRENLFLTDAAGVQIDIQDQATFVSGGIIEDLAPGDYQFTFLGGDGVCDGTLDFTVENTEMLEVDPNSYIPTNPACSTTASITIEATGGSGNYTYTWDDDNVARTDPTRTDLLAGVQYFVTVTEDSGCPPVVNPVAIEFTADAINILPSQLTGMIDCDGTTGSIIFTPDANDMEVYFLDIGNGPVNGLSINNLPQDDYMVQVGLVNNPSCITPPMLVSVQQSASIDLSLLMIDSLHCGFATGEIAFTPLGFQMITLTLFDQAGAVVDTDGSLLEDIAPGTYDLTIVDEDDPNGCPTEINNIVIREQFEVDQTSIAAANIIQPTCGGSDFGSISINVSGGILPYTFEWNDGVITDDPTRTDLVQGDQFQVTITDAGGQCSEESGFLTIDQVQGLAITQSDLTITDVSCDGTLGSISFIPDANDPNTYIIEVDGMQSQPGGAIENLAIDDYDVTLSIAGTPGCNISFNNVPVVASANLALDINNVTLMPDCSSFLSALELDPGAVTGNFTLTLFEGNFETVPATNALQLTDIAPGNYRLNVSNGICDADIDVDVDVAPINSSSVLNAEGPTCNGSGDDGSIELAVGSADTDFTLDWSDGFSSTDLTRTDLVPDTYSVTITNATGCSTTIDNIELSFELDGQFPAIIQMEEASCRGAADGIIEFQDDGMTQFLWDDGGTGARRTDLIGNIGYVVTRMVAGNTQCTQDFVINNIDFGGDIALAPDDIIQTSPACFGGVGVIELPLGAVQNGMPPFSDFTLIGLDPNFTDLMISGEDGVFSDVPPNINFQVSFLDANGCQVLSATRLEDGDPVVINPVEIISEPVCSGDANGARSIDISGGSSGMFDITWSSGETEQDVSSSTAVALSSGLQSVTITDQLCGADTISFMVEEGTAVTVLDEQINVVSCFGGSDGAIIVDLQGDPADFSYGWTQFPMVNSNMLSDLEAGDYDLIIGDNATGCISEPLQFTVPQPDEIITSLNESASMDISCNSLGTITLNVEGGNGGFEFEWEDFPQLTSFSEDNLGPGIYNINITDSQGCTDSFTTELEAASDISFEVSAIDSIVCSGETTFVGVENVQGGVAPLRYSIIEGGNLIDIDLQTEVGAGTFIFNVFDAMGCSAPTTSTVVISDPDPPLIELGPDTTIDLGLEFELEPDIITLIGIDSVNYFSDDPINIIPFGMDGISFTPDNDVTITAVVIDQDGCTATDDIEISVSRTRNVYIPNAFIPTTDPTLLNDLENSVFTVALGIGADQVTALNIYDRYGNLIHEGGDVWDGTDSNGDLVNPGVFAYFVSVLFTDGQVLNFSGDVTVIH